MRKLTLSLISIILLASLGFGWALDQYFENYSDSNDKDIISNYEVFGQQLADSIDSLKQTSEFIEKWNNNNNNRIILTDKNDFPLPTKIESDFINGKNLILESDKKLSLHYYLPNENKVLTFTPDELIHSTHLPTVSLVLTLLFYVGVLSFILLWLYPLVKRLKLLKMTARELGSGDLSKRIESSRSSYISDIENEFNRMARKIETLIFDNKIIGSAVSHDLRTPLSRIRLGLDVLSETSNQQEREKYQSRLSDDIDEMQSLIEVLLDYAKLEQSLVNIKKQKIDLSTIAFKNKNYYIDKKYSLDILTLNKENIIEGDSKYLNMLCKNLLNNAFSHANKQVIFEIVSDKNNYYLNIHDDGKGVPEDKKNDILKPFIKFDSDGYGMGLAIVERIAHWHRAELLIKQSNRLSGALFQVKFSKS